MKVFRQKLSVIAYLMLIAIVISVSVFTGQHGNFIIIVFCALTGIFYMTYGVIQFKNNKYKSYRSIVLGASLIIFIYLMPYKNIQILKEKSENATVFSVLRKQADLQKKADEYNKVFKSFKYKNITVYYHPSLETAVPLIKTYLDQAEADTARLFSNTGNNPLTIKLDYDEKVFSELEPELVNSQAFYKRNENRINILVRDCYSDILSIGGESNDFKNNLLHEFCHYKIKEFVEYSGLEFKKVPAWINEGAASYIGFERTNQVDRPKFIMPFNQLEDPFEWTEHSNETNGEIYVQAYYAVSKLIKLNGESIIEKLLLNTKDISFEAAFKKVTGFNLEEYQQELEGHIKKGRLKPIFS